MKIKLLILMLSLIVLVCSGCVIKKPHPTPQQTTFDQLSSNLKQFNGRDIIIDGFYFQGFEVVVLSENLVYSGYAQGHLVPEGTMLWIEGGIPKEVDDRLPVRFLLSSVNKPLYTELFHNCGCRQD